MEQWRGKGPGRLFLCTSCFVEAFDSTLIANLKGVKKMVDSGTYTVFKKGFKKEPLTNPSFAKKEITRRNPKIRGVLLRERAFGARVPRLANVNSSTNIFVVNTFQSVGGYSKVAEKRYKIAYSLTK